MKIKRRERFFLFSNQISALLNLIVMVLSVLSSVLLSISLLDDVQTWGDAFIQFFFTTPLMAFFAFLVYKLFEITNNFQNYYHNYQKLATLLKLNATKSYGIKELEEILKENNLTEK